MIRLAVAGATGRMGRCVLERAAADDRFDISAALTQPVSPEEAGVLRVGDRDIPTSTTLTVAVDVLIDFTVADGTMAWLEVCRERAIPMVIGATGHDANQHAIIKKAASSLPIVQSPNFSMGIQLLLRIVEQVTKQLGPEYDAEIVETHHRKKTDAPSGTALAILAAIDEAAGRAPGLSAVHGREGLVGERPRGQVGLHAIRMGEIVGQHEVLFSGPGETLTIGHTAHSRDTFAVGALRAAAWLIGQPPALYGLGDVLSGPHPH